MAPPHLTIVDHLKPSILRNNLLQALSANDLALLEPHLEGVELERGDVIVEPNKPIQHVVFPEDAIISIVASTSGGRRIEVGIIGRDGVTGTSILHGADTTPHEIFTQVPGSALRMAADDLRTAIRTSSSLHGRLLRYAGAFNVQIAYTALSHGSYTIEERLARWLLMCHDRVDGDDLPLVHEFLVHDAWGAPLGRDHRRADPGSDRDDQGHARPHQRPGPGQARRSSRGAATVCRRRSTAASAGRSDLALRLPERERPQLLKTTLFAMGALAGCASQHIWSAAQHARPDRQNGEDRPGPEARAAEPSPANAKRIQMATRNDTNEQNKAADEAARTARNVTNEAARVGEQTARAGADVFRRGSETARDSLQSGLNTATQGFQRIADQFTQVLGFNGPQSEELVRRSSENLQAVSQASTVLARGFQEVSHEVLGLVQDRVQKNIDAVNRLAGCRSVQDFVAVQSDLARDNLQQLIDTNKRVAELSVRVADEAARAIQAQGKANQARRAA